MAKFLYLEGLTRLAKTMNGTETIHLGIRPYEMHAGNILAIVAYPLLLCEELERNGTTPKMTFILSLNDWEQDTLMGEDIYKYSLDVWPKDTTIEYSLESDGQLTSLVWGKKIIDTVNEIKKKYPGVNITPINNSSLKNHPYMKQVILHTINNQDLIKQTMLSASGRPTNNSKSCFANALCPDCKHANTGTVVLRTGKLKTNCQKCGVIRINDYENLSFWIHHKPLFAARWKIFGFTHSISGGDHYNEGDVSTRSKLYSVYFNKRPPKLNMLFSPVLISYDGQKMSKSRGNYSSAKVEDILLLAKNNRGPRVKFNYPEV